MPIRPAAPGRRTTIAIERDVFLLNGRPTYPGRNYKGMKIEGLLIRNPFTDG